MFTESRKTAILQNTLRAAVKVVRKKFRESRIKKKNKESLILVMQTGCFISFAFTLISI